MENMQLSCKTLNSACGQACIKSPLSPSLFVHFLSASSLTRLKRVKGKKEKCL